MNNHVQGLRSGSYTPSEETASRYEYENNCFIHYRSRFSKTGLNNMYNIKPPRKASAHLTNFIQSPAINFYKTDKNVTHASGYNLINSFGMQYDGNSSAHTIGMNTFMTTNPIGTHNLNVVKKQINADFAK